VEIQDANGLWCVHIDKAMTSLGAINDRAYAFGPLHATPMDLDSCNIVKAVAIGQP
jgi:hypothetical protein